MILKAVFCLVIVIWPCGYSSAVLWIGDIILNKISKFRPLLCFGFLGILVEQRDPRCNPDLCESIELPYLQSDDAAKMEVTIGTRSRTSDVELHCESGRERCTIPGLNDPHFPFIYRTTFNISYTMRNGSQAASWFTIRKVYKICDNCAII